MGFTRNKNSIIWVISDTHLRRAQSLPEAFCENIRRDDIIFHLGDYVSLDVLEYLNGKCRLEAISGNCDPPDIRRLLPSKKTIELSGKKIGSLHGRGGISETESLVKSEFDNKVDIALFGHTHLAKSFKNSGTLFLNPGSLTDGRGEKPTFAVIHLEDQPWAEILES